MKDTKDVGTSPRHPRLRAVSPVTSKPTRPLFELPLELVHRILELAVDDHPEDICRDKSSTYDPRDHGWREGVTLETLTGYAKEHHKGISLMLVCKAFYHHLLPRFLSSPTLTTATAITAFAQVSQELGSYVKTLVFYPGANYPSDELQRAWRTQLPIILPNLSSLEALVPGIWTMILSMDLIACSLPSNNRITTLDQLDHFAALDISASSGPPLSLQNPTLSLMARCPNLKRISLGGINLLEKGRGFIQTSRDLLSEDESGEWSASDSVVDRFMRVLKLGVAFGGVDGQDGGLESALFWENSVMSVGCLRELLECLPRLRCFHLDVFSYIAPSSSATPFYDPGAKLFSLPAFIPFLANLVELTFAPLFGDTIRFTGNLDEILSHLPHLLRLELRSDFVTPTFLRNVLAPGAPEITYLCFHVLPPHTPAYHNSDGTRGLAVTVCLFTSRSDIIDLAERAGEVFSAGIDWPAGAMEDGRDAGAGGGWYDLLMRLASLAVRCRSKVQED